MKASIFPYSTRDPYTKGYSEFQLYQSIFFFYQSNFVSLIRKQKGFEGLWCHFSLRLLILLVFFPVLWAILISQWRIDKQLPTIFKDNFPLSPILPCSWSAPYTHGYSKHHSKDSKPKIQFIFDKKNDPRVSISSPVEYCFLLEIFEFYRRFLLEQRRNTVNLSLYPTLLFYFFPFSLMFYPAFL